MRLSTMFSLAGAAAVVAASPLADFERRTLPPSACSEVNLIVDLLNLYKATPFCSSFLSIPTYTTTIVSVASTTYTTGTITSTSVSISYSTSTVTVTTSTPTVTGTETTIVATISTVLTTTSSYTATVYTTGAAKRREAQPEPAAELVGRNVAIPEFLKEIETEAISSACLCLSIPTKTASALSTSTTVIDTAASTTITSTTVSVVVVITTTTSAVPTFAVLPATTTVYSSTEIIYTAIATETVNPCQNPVIYNNEDQERNTKLIFTEGSSWEDCCTQCFFDYTNCYDYQYQDDSGSCSMDITTDVFGPTSPQCPSGIGSNPPGSARYPGPNGFVALGPCFGTNGA